MAGTADIPQDNRIALLEEVRVKLRRDHPEWYAQYEDVDPFFADRVQVQELLSNAPTDFAAGFVSGLMVMRQQLAIATGQEF